MSEHIERSMAQTDEAIALANWMGEEIERLRARNKRLEEALQFYADEETHEGGPTGPAPIDLDLGDRARDALESETFMEEA